MVWRSAYTLGLYLLLPLVLLRLWWRGRRAPAYRRRWSERLGFVRSQSGASPIWIHAVSVGEVQAAVPLIKLLLARNPDLQILVTTTTPTGSQRVTDHFGDRVHHCYAPYDLPDAVARFLDRSKPRMALIMETEIWPNLYHACRQRHIPLIVANARLSARSARGYARVAGLTCHTLADVTLIAAQTQHDADRFLALGALREQVHVTGSIKFDFELPPDLPARAQALRRSWGADRPVWIASSTHAGEEQQVLEAHAMLRKHMPDALLVLVPRHPERFAEVAGLCRRHGHSLVLRSEQRECDASTSVYLGDSMGELLLFYAASDVAFVGGSLVPHGGHNVLEPAALGIPVIVGPHTFNFADVTRLLLEAGGARQAGSAQELMEWLRDYLGDAGLRRSAGEKGREMVASNRGALQRLMGIIDPYV